MGLFNGADNPWFKASDGAPPPRHKLGTWLTYKKFASAAFVTLRRDRERLRALGGAWYGCVINWSLAGQQTLEFQTTAPGVFAALMITGDSFQPEGALALLLDPYRDRQLVDQPISFDNFCGTARKPFILRRSYRFAPLTPILAKVSNLSANPNRGQIVLWGSMLPPDTPTGDPADQADAQAQRATSRASNIQQVQNPPWVDPPAGSESFSPTASVALPAIGQTAQIIGPIAPQQLVVPQGRSGVIRAIGIWGLGTGASGIAGWNNGDGNLIFQVMRNGVPEKNYEKITMLYGSPNVPREIRGIHMRENDVFSLTVLNNKNGPNGGVPPAGQLVGGTFDGWFYPKGLDPESA